MIHSSYGDPPRYSKEKKPGAIGRVKGTAVFPAGFAPNPRGPRVWRVLGLSAAVFLLCAQTVPAPAPAPPSSAARLRLIPILTHGLEQPVFIGHAGDHSRRLFILEQPGRIRILREGTLQPAPFLDLSRRVRGGGERGLLGLAFHPRFRNNGRVFVNYTRQPDGATIVSEFRVSNNPDRALDTETILIVIPQPYANHNGGMLAFGPDAYLYIATGDGGAGGDPGNRGQDPRTMLGKILRIDVDRGDPYGIPPGNPFAGEQTGQATFALGFRNPWRFSFDRQTGALWAADVGQDRWEEINVVEVGHNYGWRIMEGAHCFRPSQDCSRTGLTLPVAAYRNHAPHCAVTGGYVYRGDAVTFLRGAYVFGDYCSGRIMGLRNGRPRVLTTSSLRIASFGEDEDGELYVVDHGGGIYKIARTSPP